MFYLIYGTNFQARKLARVQITNLLNKKGILLDKILKMEKLNSENYFLLENYIESKSLFGETYLIDMEDLLTKEVSREFVYKNLESMKNSENIFLLYEADLLDVSVNKIKRIIQDSSTEILLYNAKEKIEIKRMNPFFLCELIEKRNKKEAWKEWKKIYEKYGENESAALHGAIWWKWKNLWEAYLSGDKKNYFTKYKLLDSELKYNKQELEYFGEEITFMGAWEVGDGNSFMRKIEKFILKI